MYHAHTITSLFFRKNIAVKQIRIVSTACQQTLYTKLTFLRPSVESCVPTLYVVVGSYAPAVHRPRVHWPDCALDPGVIYVVYERYDSCCICVDLCSNGGESLSNVIGWKKRQSKDLPDGLVDVVSGLVCGLKRKIWKSILI